jgi:hypothetical protein
MPGTIRWHMSQAAEQLKAGSGHKNLKGGIQYILTAFDFIRNGVSPVHAYATGIPSPNPFLHVFTGVCVHYATSALNFCGKRLKIL